MESMDHITVCLESTGSRIEGQFVEDNMTGITVIVSASNAMRFFPWTSIRYIDLASRTNSYRQGMGAEKA